MTVPANIQQAASPWGAEAVYVCFGSEGGPFTVVSASAGLPVNVVAGSVQIGGSVAVTQSGTWTVQQGGAPWSVSQSGTWTVQQGNAPWIMSQSGTWTMQPGNTANTTPWLFTQTPATSGGCSMDSYISTGASNQDQHTIKSSAGQLYGYAVFNTTASVRYVKVYNAASPTSGSTPVLRIMLPANGGANMPVGDSGLAFGTAIGIRITTGAGDSDTGAASTNDVLTNFFYK